MNVRLGPKALKFVSQKARLSHHLERAAGRGDPCAGPERGAMPREIMTLQLGGYSNFLGSHFWNIQEECMSYDDDGDEGGETSEVRHDILWRATRDTVVPRLMTLDLKSERGALRRRGYLNPDEEPAAVLGAGAAAR